MRSIVLVTGAAGFIGFHLSQKLCRAGFTVLGIDNLNDYYDVKLKESRLKILESESNFIFDKLDLLFPGAYEFHFSNQPRKQVSLSLKKLINEPGV